MSEFHEVLPQYRDEPGDVALFAAETPPQGYLECNGAAISRTTYAALFAVFGTFFGIGNGSTTFNIPDMRGVFPRGTSDGATVDPDRTTRTRPSDVAVVGDVAGSSQAMASSFHRHAPTTATSTHTWTSYSWSHTANTEGPNSPGGDVRPVNIYLMFCVRY